MPGIKNIVVGGKSVKVGAFYDGLFKLGSDLKVFDEEDKRKN